jgi:hypothetical protein
VPHRPTPGAIAMLASIAGFGVTRILHGTVL